MTRTWIARGGIAAVALLGIAFAVGSVGSGDTDRAGGLIGRGGDIADRALAPSDGAAAAERSVALGDDIAGPEILAQEDTFGDRVIRTADMTVEVDDGAFDAAWQQARDIAARFDGSVVSSSRGRDDFRSLPEGDDAAFGSLTIRVPQDRFEDALAAMRRLGDVRADRTSSQDVTEEFVDLQSRLRHLRAQEDALLKLLARAESVQDILTVQRELANTQAEIERVTGRINFLEARTEFSTITLTLAEPSALAGFEPKPEGPSFAKAWETARTGLTRIATGAMIAGLWLAPFAVIGLLVLWGLRGRRPAPQA